MNDALSPDSLIPVTVLTGFLGSGKTTLLNHLVQQPAMARTLVIINEFGEMALDHLLVAHSAEDIVMEMRSGCLCCTIRGDLVKTLRDITWRFARNAQKQFDRVLIETTGLADPAPIIHTLMTDHALVTHYRLDGIVTTIDMATGSQTLDRHVEAVKQLAMADCLLLTKNDLIAQADGRRLEERLRAINPAASRYSVDFGVIDAAKVLGLGLYDIDGKPDQVANWLREEAYVAGANRHDHRHDGHEHDMHDDRHDDVEAHGHRHHEHHDHQHHHHHDVNRHDDHILAFCFTVEQPIPEEGFNAWLELLMSLMGQQILRVKGILNVVGSAQPVVIHGVQHIFHPPVTLPAWPDADRRSRLVFITQDVKRELIEKTFHAFMPSASAVHRIL